jgi:two-component system phosphate regulon sensor histidine kinase PhoR
MGDAAQFELAINNLIDNAVKYSGENAEILIQIKNENHQVVISVSDSGPGIDKQHHEKIFEKFYRVQGGDVHDVKGFGLGLSFVKQIIGAMQGTVQVSSRVGQGSTFTIQLPVHD